MTSAHLLMRAQHLRAERTPFVLATVVRAHRPTSAKPGDSALVLPDGTVEGFVGGSCAAGTVRVQGLRLIASGASTLLRITPDPSPGPEAGEALTDDGGLVTVANPCLSGGTLEIFMEAVLPPALVHVFGDAPVARAVAVVGGALGYSVTATADTETPIAPDTHAVVVASHGVHEDSVIRAALAVPVPYLALVASRRRAAGVFDEMGLSEAERGRIHAPAGLDIGARGASEIALSIFAEMVAERPDHEPASGPPGDTVGAAGAAPGLLLAIDPVCGMEVAIVADAISTVRGGRSYYFCGPGCRDAFEAAPDRYLA